MAGVAVRAELRQRGVGAAMSSWLLERGFEGGAEFAHLNPDTDGASRLYGRLGFTELPGYDIYVDLSTRGASSPTVAAVAADVAIRAADAQVDGLLGVRGVAEAPDGRGVDASEPAGAEHVVLLGVALAEGELDLAAVDQVELLLAVVEVGAAGVAGRHDDRVDAERLHVELAPDLAEARTLAHPVDAADGPAVAGGGLRHAFILGAVSSPNGSLEELIQPLKDDPERSAVLLDVDGVLAPIVQHPDDAHMPETTRRPLIEVAKRYGVVACVSGRRASDARRVVSLGSIAYLGSHGSEILRPGSIAPEMDRELQAWTRRVQNFARDAFTESLRKLRVRLEDKEAIAALHWRDVPDEDEAEAAVREVAEAAEKAGFNAHWGRKVLEIRPPVRIDKGAGIVSLLRDVELEAADLRRRRHHGHRRLPRPHRAASRSARSSARCGWACSSGDETPSALEDEADVMVDGTDGVRDLLRALIR